MEQRYATVIYNGVLIYVFRRRTRTTQVSSV